MIRDFINVLDVVYQNPGVGVKTLLGDRSFQFAQKAEDEDGDSGFAEFDI